MSAEATICEMSQWLPILGYREFYDLPRAFIVQRDERVMLFDCPFDGALDDYVEQYTVYELSETGEELRAMPSWS